MSPREQRPTFVLRLRALPGRDAIRELRMALKTLIRRHGLRCIEVTEEHGEPDKEERVDGTGNETGGN
jgi:hypothetical protein